MSASLTSSPLAVRLGAELPQIIHEPPDVASHRLADATLELADEYELFEGPASPSQALRIRNGMATRADGKWAASRVADFGGRQGAGKSGTIIVRIFGGIFLAGEQLAIYTAHEFPTCNEIFLRIGAIFEAWDDFQGLVLHERRAHGDQGFELKGPKGAEITGKRRLLFKTRTGKSGRGFAKADLLIYDEAQHLMPEHVAGSGPAKLAHPNPQSWYAGSGGLSGSVKAWELRRQAILGTGGRLSYTEHTAQVVSVAPSGKINLADPDPEDRDAWARANPGLGRWVTEEGMEDMRAELGALFPREGLCVWEPEPGSDGGPIPLDRWNELIDADAKPEDATVRLALDAPPDRTSATFSIGGKLANGLTYFEVRDHISPNRMRDLVVRARELSDGHKTDLILPPGSPALSWKPDFEAAGITVDVLTPAEFAAAFGYIQSQVADGTLRHRGQPELTNAVAGLGVKVSGDVEVPTRRSSSSNVAPFMAACAAAARVPTEARKSADAFVVYA